MFAFESAAPCFPLAHECGRGKGEGESMSTKVIYVALGVMLLALGSVATAQQPKKVSRIGIYRRATQLVLVSPPVPRQFGWLCASVAT
jgi:hypothetical protein